MRTANPRITKKRGRFELFPRLVFMGDIWFDSRPPVPIATAVQLTGRTSKALMEALNTAYGTAVEVDEGIRVVQNPGVTFPNTRQPAMTVAFRKLQWCDGSRIILLEEEDQQFTMVIRGPRVITETSRR